MNESHVAALLYLLGRHVTTALRVRRENEEIVLSRHQAPPLRELHDALAAGEQLAIDPWVDLEDGSRALVCLWARATDAPSTIALLPGPFSPHVRIALGASDLLVWLLDQPAADPAGIDASHTMKTVATALEVEPGDIRDYIPIPPDPSAVAFIDPDRSVDITAFVQWAQGIVDERRARERRQREVEAIAHRLALSRRLVVVLDGLGHARRRQEDAAYAAEVAALAHAAAEETAARAADAARLAQEPAAEISGTPLPHSQVSLKPSIDDAACEPTPPVEEAEPLSPSAPLEPTVRDAPDTDTLSEAPADALQQPASTQRLRFPIGPERLGITAARSTLTAALSRVDAHGWDEVAMQTKLQSAMAALGTREVWSKLGVTMTSLRDGTLYGLHMGQWVSLKEVVLSTAPQRGIIL